MPRSHPPALRWLRFEGALFLLAGLLAAWAVGMPFWWGLLIFCAPEIGIAAYALGPRAGGAIYNLAHGYTLPLLLLLASWALRLPPVWIGAGALWIAHIGFDRMLGYGLKGASFHDTHLGRIGRPAA